MANTTNAQARYSGIRRAPNRGTEADMHEWQREELYKQGAEKDFTYKFATGSGQNTGPIVTQVGYVDNYLYFDSANKNTTSDIDNGRLAFSIPTQNNNVIVSNCIGIKMRDFYFPRISGSVLQPDIFFFRRVYVLVDPLPSSAIQGANNSKHHFEFEVENLSGIAVRLVPVTKEGDGGIFYFPKPVNSISDITFQFLVPAPQNGGSSFRPLPIPADYVQLRTVPNTNPAQFEILSAGVTTAVIGPIGVAPAPGYAIFFSGFNSTNGALNSQVNDPIGQFVTTIVSATVFEVANLDFTVAPANVTQFFMSGIVGKNRIAFTTQFISIRANENTNFIQVTHK